MGVYSLRQSQKRISVTLVEIDAHPPTRQALVGPDTARYLSVWVTKHGTKRLARQIKLPVHVVLPFSSLLFVFNYPLPLPASHNPSSIH